MVAPFPQPSAVPMTMPSTSPIAQPVRQCAVAETACRVSSRPLGACPVSVWSSMPRDYTP